MTRGAHEPIRTCIGCRVRKPKAELIRYVATGGEIVPDPTQKMPGRGCYICGDEACMAKAIKRGAFKRALRTSNGTPERSQATMNRPATPKPESGVTG